MKSVFFKYGGESWDLGNLMLFDTFEKLKYLLFINRDVELHGHSVSLDYRSVEQLWNTLHRKYQPVYIFLSVYLMLMLGYILVGLFFIAVEQLNIWQKYKIQANRKNVFKNYYKCFMNIIFNYFVVIVPMILMGWPIFNFLGLKYDGRPFPNLWEIVWQNTFFLLAEDILQYWFHRWLHIPLLYKHIHKTHHDFISPFALCASYAHPAEIVILGLAAFIPPVLLKSHLFIFYIWVLIRQLDATITHCGYDLPFNVFDYLAPFYGGTKFHDYHHTSFIYNFASRFTWIDKLFGTYKDSRCSKLKSNS